mmetsp:Transcript_29195/g.56440  ORF Transcript_29195/g.56440 Transcript_29195/m.56440 type:complete len:204 (-) Transcript_29195:753-1364(-)
MQELLKHRTLTVDHDDAGVILFEVSQDHLLQTLRLAVARAADDGMVPRPQIMRNNALKLNFMYRFDERITNAVQYTHIFCQVEGRVRTSKHWIKLFKPFLIELSPRPSPAANSNQSAVRQEVLNVTLDPLYQLGRMLLVVSYRSSSTVKLILRFIIMTLDDKLLKFVRKFVSGQLSEVAFGRVYFSRQLKSGFRGFCFIGTSI